MCNFLQHLEEQSLCHYFVLLRPEGRRGCRRGLGGGAVGALWSVGSGANDQFQNSASMGTLLPSDFMQVLPVLSTNSPSSRKLFLMPPTGGLSHFSVINSPNKCQVQSVVPGGWGVSDLHFHPFLFHTERASGSLYSFLGG